jgi:hypothetical protein
MPRERIQDNMFSRDNTYKFSENAVPGNLRVRDLVKVAAKPGIKCLKKMDNLV